MLSLSRKKILPPLASLLLFETPLPFSSPGFSYPTFRRDPDMSLVSSSLVFFSFSAPPFATRNCAQLVKKSFLMSPFLLKLTHIPPFYAGVLLMRPIGCYLKAITLTKETRVVLWIFAYVLPG